MRKLTFSLMFILVAGLLLSTLSIVLAQQQGARQTGADQQNRQGQRQGPQMDPEAMIQQRLERIMEQLKLSDEDSAVLKPKIEGIMRLRMEQNRETRELINSLREAINAKNAGQIKSKLAEIKSKRAEHKTKAEALEKQLTELLTLEQEAILTVSGVVNSDGSGFFGGPGGQPRIQVRNQPGQGQ